MVLLVVNPIRNIRLHWQPASSSQACDYVTEATSFSGESGFPSFLFCTSPPAASRLDGISLYQERVDEGSEKIHLYMHKFFQYMSSKCIALRHIGKALALEASNLFYSGTDGQLICTSTSSASSICAFAHLVPSSIILVSKAV